MCLLHHTADATEKKLLVGTGATSTVQRFQNFLNAALVFKQDIDRY
jgi:hypothetical protein